MAVTIIPSTRRVLRSNTLAKAAISEHKSSSEEDGGIPAIGTSKRTTSTTVGLRQSVQSDRDAISSRRSSNKRSLDNPSEEQHTSKRQRNHAVASLPLGSRSGLRSRTRLPSFPENNKRGQSPINEEDMMPLTPEVPVIEKVQDTDGSETNPIDPGSIAQELRMELRNSVGAYLDDDQVRIDGVPNDLDVVNGHADSDDEESHSKTYIGGQLQRDPLPVSLPRTALNLYDIESIEEPQRHGKRRQVEMESASHAIRDESPLFVPSNHDEMEQEQMEHGIGERRDGSPEIGSNPPESRQVSHPKRARSNKSANEPANSNRTSRSKRTRRQDPEAEQTQIEAKQFELKSSQFGDDSAYFEPPPVSSSNPTVTISREGLVEMLKDMDRGCWSEQVNIWEEELLMEDSEEPEAWLDRHNPRVGTWGAYEFAKNNKELWRAIHKSPTASDLAAQGEYLREPECLRTFEKSLHTLWQTVNYICTRTKRVRKSSRRKKQDPRHEKCTREITLSLQHHSIPLLVLTLKATFLMGSTTSREVTNRLVELPYEGEFTTCTLKLLLKVNGWLEMLYTAMKAELQIISAIPTEADLTDEERVHEVARLEKDTELGDRLGKHIQAFKHGLEKALNEMEVKAQWPLQRRLAGEEDRRIQDERAQKERQREAARQRQMSLHWASLNKMSSQQFERSQSQSQSQSQAYSQSQSQPRAQSQSSSLSQSRAQAQAYSLWQLLQQQRQEPSLSQPQTQAPWQSQAPPVWQSQTQRPHKLTPKEEYKRNNCGWWWDEDNKLLKMLKRVSQPNYWTLVEDFPGRSVEEIMGRATQLKARYRIMKQNKGEEAPGWCYT